ncbi:uncharacterized protein LOC128224425 isoform X2 [Mya arenaria]|uniref:uncharacterized protein LOC128224425 isoform X2 n=1 Tax=Mya arenaria TaxID=6604 RepID=UPI0022E2C1E1|nr:uncharacterized protein LOC128224425 isoform X2 [Mya arenaria]
MWFIIALVLEGVCILRSEDEFPQIKHRSACDSPEFCQTNRYSIECPVNEYIAMMGVSYGAKPITNYCPKTQACINQRQCCTYEVGDCIVPFNDTEMVELYSKCSQMQQCGWWFASSTKLPDDCRVRDRSNYIWADFQCVTRNQFVDMCSQQTVTAKTVHLQHSAVLSSHNFDQCSCIVTPDSCNTSTRLEFRAVDIRLHSVGDTENISKCTTASRLELVGQKDLKRYSCHPDAFLHGFKTFHVTSEKNVMLYLHKKHREYPQSVWLEVKASNPEVNVRVTCGPRSIETASRCPASPISQSNKLDDVEEVPDKSENTPTIIHLDPDAIDHGKGQNDDEPGEKQNTALAPLVGGIVAGVVVLLLLLLVVRLIIRKKKHESGGKKCLPFAEESHQANYYEPINDSDSKARDANLIYHEPWGKQDGVDVTNRAKQKDLAYATSEEIKVLIEKMERDRHSIIEGDDDYPSPDPTYYRHVSTFTFHPPERKNLNGNNEGCKNKTESEDESLASDNCGTEKLESEDSKVEADRVIDSDCESHKVESETVSAYFDGYESPRVSSSHPSDISTARTSVLSDNRSELPNYVYEPDDVILEDHLSDLEIPDEHAPPIGAAILNQLKDKRKSGDLTEQDEGNIVLGAYREPRGSVDSGIREATPDSPDTEDLKSDYPYSPVYDEIAEQQTRL